METNWLMIIMIITAILAFVFFFVNRNQKDKKELEHELNESDKK
jgi:preprotein translocase subunit YajC